MNKKVINIIKNIPFIFPLRVLKSTIKEIPEIIVCFLYSFRTIKKNKIVFSSFNGKQFNAQPFLIYQELRKRNIENIEFVWILNDNIVHDNGIVTVLPFSSKAIKELMTAGIWIDNCRKPYWLKKRREQLYIQTWHGPICLKAVEKDAEKMLPAHYVLSAKRDSIKTDYMIAETIWRKNNIENAFWYNGKIICAEFKDYMLDSKISKNKVCRHFGFDPDSRILLYVPTFRRDHSTKHYIKDFKSVLYKLESKDNCSWNCIIRLHPNVSKKSKYINYDKNIVDGTDYPSITELICASDLLITDYSGCLFQGLRIYKQVILYIEDYAEYLIDERGLYFDLSHLPVTIVRTMCELLDKISTISYDNVQNIFEFNKEIGYYKEDASKVSADIIEKYLGRRK